MTRRLREDLTEKGTLKGLRQVRVPGAKIWEPGALSESARRELWCFKAVRRESDLSFGPPVRRAV